MNSASLYGNQCHAFSLDFAHRLAYYEIIKSKFLGSCVGFPLELIPSNGLRTEMIWKFFLCGKGSENPEFRNDFLFLFFPKPEISGTLFQNFGTVRNIVPESSGLGNNRTGIFSLEKVLENVKDILNLIIECAPGLAEVKVILL